MEELPHKAFPDGEFTVAELKALGGCNALTNQEAKIVLDRFVATTAKANKLWAPPPLAARAIDYLARLEPKARGDSHADSVQKLRETVQQAGVYEFEMALLANLMPETAEEALALVPSLSDRFAENEPALQAVLDEIVMLKALQ